MGAACVNHTSRAHGPCDLRGRDFCKRDAESSNRRRCSDRANKVSAVQGIALLLVEYFRRSDSRLFAHKGVDLITHGPHPQQHSFRMKIFCTTI